MQGGNLDLVSPTNPEPATPAPRGGRKFLGIHYACCDVYSRIYIATAGSHYSGRCPKCRQEVIVNIGGDGSSSRFFTAG